MSSFIPSVPTGTVPLKQDYLNLQNNFQQLDTTYGVDHYKFSDATANNGFHNTVTTPVIAPIGMNPSVPPTPIANKPQFYGFQDSANIGVLQYSIQSKNAMNQNVAPSPVTMFQSQVGASTVPASNVPLDILDFTGLNRAMGKIMAFNQVTPTQDWVDADFYWDGTTLLVRVIDRNTSGPHLNASAAGTVLILSTSSLVALTNIYWTLQFYRLS